VSGFDNGTLQSGVFFQAKQFGPILRGLGPPVPQAGVVGDVYIDTQTFQLFTKRSPDSAGDVDPWGHYLFVVPLAYRATLKWFTASAPDDSLGIAGDYALLWGGWSNYGIQPSLYGPKQATSWPENGNGPNATVAVLNAGNVLQVGVDAEGAQLPVSNSTQLIGVGIADEFVLAVPVTVNAGDPVTQLGLQSGPAAVTVTVNPLYTAEDEHAV